MLNKTQNFVLLTTLLSISLVGCDSVAQKVIQCDSLSFEADIHPRLATISLEDGKHQLERSPSASGEKYKNSNILFWLKDETALLVVNNETHKNCTVKNR